MRLAGHGGAALAHEKVEIDAAIGLQHVVEVEALIAGKHLLMMGHCTAREAAAFFAKIGGIVGEHPANRARAGGCQS